MIANSFSPQKKFTNNEIISAITFLDQIGKLTDEELKKRDLKIGETQKINHFLGAVWCRESTLLPKQALTLLRLTPLLIERGSNTVHQVILTATPKVLEAYGKVTDLAEKKQYADVIKTAGRVCMDRRLGATLHENRVKEFQMFESFIGETPEYQEAKARFLKRNRPSARLLMSVGQQAVNATRLNPCRRYSGRGAYE